MNTRLRHNPLSPLVAGLLAFLTIYAIAFKTVHVLGDVRADASRAAAFLRLHPQEASLRAASGPSLRSALPPSPPCPICAILTKLSVPASLAIVRVAPEPAASLLSVVGLVVRLYPPSVIAFACSRAPPGA